MKFVMTCHKAVLAASLFLGFNSAAYSAPIHQNPNRESNTAVIAETASRSSSMRVDANRMMKYMLQHKYAVMLGVRPKKVSNIALYSFIDQWYGVKYAWGGTTKRGIDCSALVQKMYRNVFVTSIRRTSMLQFNSLRTRLKSNKLKEGDLVFFKTRGNVVSHVGVYLQNNRFVHSCSSKGVTISSLDEKYWSRKYAGAGKLY